MENESRGIFYLLATEKVEQAIAEEGWSIGEALWILLRTWNEAYYRTKPFDGTFNDYIGRPNELILAPKFFSLWDREITRTYKIHLGRQGRNVGYKEEMNTRHAAALALVGLVPPFVSTWPTRD